MIRPQPLRRFSAAIGISLGLILSLTRTPLEAGDKWKHFGISAAFGAAGETVIHVTTDLRQTDRILCGTALGTLPGLIKEILDSRENGNRFSGRDLAADLAGAALGAVLANLVNNALGIGDHKEHKKTVLALTLSYSF